MVYLLVWPLWSWPSLPVYFGGVEKCLHYSRVNDRSKLFHGRYAATFCVHHGVQALPKHVRLLAAQTLSFSEVPEHLDSCGSTGSSLSLALFSSN